MGRSDVSPWSRGWWLDMIPVVELGAKGSPWSRAIPRIPTGSGDNRESQKAQG